MKRLLPLLLTLALVACGDNNTETAAPAESPAPAPATDAPAEEPAAPAEPAEAAESAGEETSAEAETSSDAPVETAETPAPETPAPAPPVMDPARAPRLGTDYDVLPNPQPTMGQGGIEVAEVFSYTCIHCANLQPLLNTWKADLPGDVRFVYVPGAFGGVSDHFARAYYAAEAMGLVDKTHDDLFKATLIEREFTSGSLEEIADWYAENGGADRDAFLSTMNSFAVTAKINRARQFALRTGVDATPMIIVNGKYKAMATADRGMQGLLDTVDWLVAHERAGTTP